MAPPWLEISTNTQYVLKNVEFELNEEASASSFYFVNRIFSKWLWQKAITSFILCCFFLSLSVLSLIIGV